MIIIKPPTPLPISLQPRSVFLAGSIEMGVAENWQTIAEQMLVNTPGWLLNPRRDDWDSSWVQSKSNPQFNAQVSWELEAMERADRILVYFDPSTKSPITLMELGLYASSGKVVVCCPGGFWRRGNVDMVCDRYNVPMESDLKHLIGWEQLDTLI